MKIIKYKNENIVRYGGGGDENLMSEWNMSKVISELDNWWLKGIDKQKVYEILHHTPNDFTCTWDGNNRKVIPPKINFWNIVEYINFINWLKYESIIYYLGVPKILRRQIDSFIKMVERYIPNYIYYK